MVAQAAHIWSLVGGPLSSYSNATKLGTCGATQISASMVGKLLFQYNHQREYESPPPPTEVN